MAEIHYRPLLGNISDRFFEILEDNLVGIYIHVSMAFGCFRWEGSDIDFVAVVNDEISQQIKLDLLSS